MRLNHQSPCVGAFLMLCLAGTASAGEFDRADGYPGSRGFAGPALSGDYVGAPLTRFPRPSEIVPPAWGYGTFGVPTVTGIRAAPTGTPTITIINGEPPRRGRLGARSPARERDSAWTSGPAFSGESPDGARVVTVTVPRR